MEALHFFKQLYSLDTLDTRLTTSRDLSRISSEPAKDEAAKDNSKQRNVYLPPTASPSRWGTKEFCIYYVVLGFVIPQMFLSVIQVSSCMPSDTIWQFYNELRLCSDPPYL